MTIYGIGIDIISTSRIAKSIKNKAFINRLFNKEEIAKCNKLKNKAKKFL